MQVCIAEKPSVAAEIARVIGANNRREGFYEGGGYCVTWTFGHLCELKEPHDYDPTLKRWDFALLPILPQRFSIKLKNDNGVKRQFHIINNLFSKAESIVNCGDAGQEGELIQRWVMQLAQSRCPVYRLWISSLTEDAIRDGFANLRPSADFDSLYAAGSARAIGDWLLGMNATRAYTLRYGAKGMVLSIGRVQTPTLALIVQRYKEIANFKPQKYWELKTKYREVNFSATSGRFDKIEEGHQALAKVQNLPFQIDDIKSKQGKEAPPPLFDLTSLQVECNNKLGLSADDTLRIAQSLYEQKFTTYPRVDTKFLTDDIYPKVPSILKGLTPYAPITTPLLQHPKLPKSKKVFNNLKVTDHHAIIPTGMPPRPDMSPNEKRVYDMIARRFIANFSPDSTVNQTTVLGSGGDVQFKASGKVILDPGWRVVYGNQKLDDTKDDEQTAVLPPFQLREQGPHEPSLQEKQTQPPKLYTEATLLRAMETAGKQVEDGELSNLMKENGIGRPSTRAAIIETLFRRKYIAKERKNLVPTINGIRLIDTIKTPILKSVELTGQWEKKLRNIEAGTFSTSQFIAEMRDMATDIVRVVSQDLSSSRFQEIENNDTAPKPQLPASSPSALSCPKCGRPILKGKAAWGCSGYKEGCSLVIPFKVRNKSLTDKQLQTLLSKGEVAVRGVDSGEARQDGKFAFDSDFKVVFRPSDSATNPAANLSSLLCPKCGSAILEGRQAWGCSGYKAGCTFRVPYVFMCKKLTPTHLKVLIQKGKTGVIKGFVDVNGLKRDGRLVLTPSGEVALATTDGSQAS